MTSIGICVRRGVPRCSTSSDRHHRRHRPRPSRYLPHPVIVVGRQDAFLTEIKNYVGAVDEMQQYELTGVTGTGRGADVPPALFEWADRIVVENFEPGASPMPARCRVGVGMEPPWRVERSCTKQSIPLTDAPR